jgi:predicted Zn-dependent protease
MVAAIGIFRWWQVQSRKEWLATATIDQLSAAATRDEADVEIFGQLGGRARELEQWPRAARAFQHACELAPDRVENWIGWARSMYEVEGYRTADAILTNFLKLHPTSDKALMERAALRRLGKRIEAAWGDADQATRANASLGEAWALRGDLSLDMGIAAEGEKSFSKARTLMPNSAWPLVGLYQAYIAQRKFPPALEIAQSLAARFPQIPERFLYLGEAQVETAQTADDYEAARETLRKAQENLSRFRPLDQFAFYLLYGRTYYEEKRFAEALTNFLKATDIVADNPDALFLLGRTYRALGKNDLADATLKRHKSTFEDIAMVRRFQAQINDNPNDAKTRRACAEWYERRGMMQNALVQYEEMVTRGLDSDWAKARLTAMGESVDPQ